MLHSQLENLNVRPSSLDAILERHAREKFAFDRLTPAEQARFQVKKRFQYANDSWLFLRDCVFTLDQVSDTTIKPYPSDLDYLQLLTDLWLWHPLMAVPKSRRMFCSWNFISLYTHDTIFKEGRFNGFVSKKEDDAGELVQRAEFIYQKIPEWRIPRALLPAIKNGKMSQQPPQLIFEDINSKIQGFPQGDDQLRQFTLSGIFGDESAFWKDAQKFYSATKPTIDGGGRMTLVSSRAPSFFKKIVYDRLDSNDLTFKAEPPVPPKIPIEGVEVWKNPSNKFLVVDLHYTANPAKRSREWRDGVKASMPTRDFAMEYEKSWETYEGKPVFADFVKGFHSTPHAIAPERHVPLIIGVDFGLTPAMLLCQLVGRQFRILEEFVETDSGIKALAKKVWLHLRVNYPQWTQDDPDTGVLPISLYCDPNMNAKKDTDERTCAMELRDAGFRRVLPGPVDWESRKTAVEDLLVSIHKGEPALLVSQTGCPVLCEGFGGGYMFDPKVHEIEPNSVRPIKNKFSHPHDALQYACHGATAIAKQHGIKLITTAPSYGFQKER